MAQPAGKIGERTVILEIEPLGKIEVSEESVFNFPTGLPGFQQSHRFVLVGRQEYLPFTWMVSLDQPGLAFVVIDPYQLFTEYRPRLSPEDLETLGLSTQQRALLYSIVTIAPNPRESTANLRAPVALNPTLRLGRQAILASQEYSTREPMYGRRAAIEKSTGSGDNEIKSQGRRELIAGSDPQAQPEHHHR